MKIFALLLGPRGCRALCSGHFLYLAGHGTGFRPSLFPGRPGSGLARSGQGAGQGNSPGLFKIMHLGIHCSIASGPN